MRRLLLMFALFPAFCFGQAVRFTGNIYTINSSAPQPGGLYPVLAIPGSTIAVCSAPANAVPCTNYATTYTNAAEAGTCPSGAQLTRDNSTSCIGVADPQGGIGFWIAAGTYQYTVVTSYGKFGPYDISVGGGGGGGSGSVTSVSVATANGFQGTVANPTTTPAITVNVDSTHVLPVNTGSTTNFLNQAGTYTVPASAALPVTTKGDLLGFSSVPARVPVGTDNFCLIANSTLSLGLGWAACPNFAVSGQAAGVVPLATGANAIGAQSHINENTSGTTTVTQQFAVNSTTTPSQETFTYNTGHPLIPGSSTSAVYGVDSSGNASISEAGAAASRPCTMGNYTSVCPPGATVTLQTNGTNNTSQTTLNLQNGTNAAVTNPSAGNVQVNAMSGPTTCTVSTATDICVTLPPYYASGAGATTTTTTGTTSPGTAVVVGSSSTFVPNEGVYIAGAGPSSTVTAFSVYSGTATGSAYSITSNVVTITATNTFPAGVPVVVTGANNNANWLDGTYIITAATGSNFSYPINHANASGSTSLSATVDAATLTATGTQIPAGNLATVAGLSTATYLNGTWEVMSSTSGTFSFQSNHSTASGSDSGTVTTNYVGTITAVPDGTHLTVTPATSTSVAGSTLVQHDDSAAFQSAINALNPGSGTVWAPSLNSSGTTAVYLWNWPFQDVTGANAKLVVPRLLNYGSVLVNINLRGFDQPVWNGITSPQAYYKTTDNPTFPNTANVIGGYDGDSNSGGFGVDFPPFTNVHLNVSGGWLQLPNNPGVVGINCTYILACTVKHMVVNGGGTGGVIPTNTAGGGIWMPAVGNNVENQIDDVTSGSIYTPYVIGEHTHVGSIYASNVNSIAVFDPGSNYYEVPGNNFSNSISADYIWGQNAAVGLSAGTQIVTVNIQNADLESVNSHALYDPSNLFRGHISYHIPYPLGGLSFCTPNNVGAQLVAKELLDCPTLPQVPQSGLIEYWPSQEGRGTTLVNSGYDFTNAMTTNAAWSSAAGFPGTVATYNGTTSASTATTATNTAFDGTLPFSVAAWVNPVSAHPANGQTIVGNLNATPTFKGWRLSTAPDTGTGGWFVFGLIDDFSVPNAVYAHTTASVIQAGVTQFVCAIYDGSGATTNSGITFYVSGDSPGVTNPGTSYESTPLTGSSATTNTVDIGYDQNISGGVFNGSIGDVRIYNRALSQAECAAILGAGPGAN